MSTTIQDGTGKRYKAKVDNEGRLYTRGVELTEFEHAIESARAFNVNTELLVISGSTESALLYFKNNEPDDVILANWFIGTTTTGGSASAPALMRVYVNPTGGTLIASQSAVELVNRNLGSSDTFDVTAYKGGDGYTITGQKATPVLYQTQGSNQRNFGLVQLSLPKGSSVAVTFQPAGLEPIQIYTGFQGYITDTETAE